MSDPYNSYGSQVTPMMQVAPAEAAATATSSASSGPSAVRDFISRLDVSESWKQKFKAIEKAGGPDLPGYRNLTSSERSGVLFNVLAFFLGPFYFIAKGLWRQALMYTIAAVALAMVFEAMGFGKAAGSVGVGFGAIYAMRANVSFYKWVVLGEESWF